MILVGFSTTGSPLSWLIRKVTGSKVSHCWLLVPFAGVDMVMEAGTTGFQLQPYGTFRKKNQIVALATPAVDLDQALPIAARWLGSRYDFLGLFGSIFVPLGRWMHRRWKNPARSDNVQFCSEAVVRVLQAAGHPGAESLDPSDTSPQDLLAFLQESGGDIEVPEISKIRPTSSA